MSKLRNHLGIVVGVDGSPGSKIAVQWAVRDAELRNVALTLVHVLPVAARTDGKRAQGQQILDEAQQLAIESRQGESLQIDCEMHSGKTLPALIELSKRATLVVAGCLGTGTLRGRHLGSVSAGLIHHAACPVAVLHDDVELDSELAQAPVVVGVDGSPKSEQALAIAFDEASRRKVGLTAIHTWRPVGVFDEIVSFPGPGWQTLRAREDEVMAERLAGWGERYPDVEVNRIVARNDPTPQLVDSSKWAQLVVVGGHGSGGFIGTIFGSVSAAVVLLTHVPVIVARGSLAKTC
ncbi:universal stress protein [Mycobacterium szulgai]|uniref:Universal stress protein n=1 Tax=Mycobacterium szulgai TaxID=1787 RepID=A0A1X2DMV9_MYCSZ|nr:universal stress protein [Mycobacterium szulgai]MCV7077547.1 universal stress protein [Mycobacterium szulgai]ORW89029.1 universal stress protein [Mycobacterium szulgai]